jgi:FMN phosphatase YigB (HAD superfamily)
MPLQAVFFDFVGTLARFVPEQDALLSRAAAVHGIALPPAAARRGLAAAGAWWQQQVAQRPLGQRSEPERSGLYQAFDQRVLEAAGFQLDVSFTGAIFATLLEMGRESHMEVFDDVAPALTALESAGYTLGVISNMDDSLGATLEALGLSPWLSLAVSSQQAGCSKPDPAIFRWTAQRAGLAPEVIAYVGDQPEIDVPGAKAAGLLPVLVDRENAHVTPEGAQRIASLGELPALLAGRGTVA